VHAGTVEFEPTENQKAASADAAFFSCCKSVAAGLLTDGVSDGDADSKHVVGIEPEIVLNVVIVALGADKDVGQAVPNIIAEAAAEVFHKVIAAGVVDAPGAAAGAKEVEPVAGYADAGEKVEANFLGQLWLEEGVDVGKDGAVVFVTVVACLVIPPRGFNVQAEAMLEGDDVNAKAGIDSAFFG
jgi:hypothetical protein